MTALGWWIFAGICLASLQLLAVFLVFKFEDEAPVSLPRFERPVHVRIVHKKAS